MQSFIVGLLCGCQLLVQFYVEYFGFSNLGNLDVLLLGIYRLSEGQG